MALLENIETLLTTESDIYIGNYPIDAVDNICTIIQINGRPSEHVFGQTKAAFRQPSIQIRIRDTSFSNGYERCEDIIDILDGYTSSTMRIMLESDIITLGKDDKHRSEFMLIFKLIVIQ